MHALALQYIVKRISVGTCFLPFVFLRNSRYTVVVVSETNTFTWKVKKATVKSSEDSEMQVKAPLVGFCV